eukprot:322693_1
MTMATNNTHFHRDIIEHVEGFIDLQSMRNALFVDRTWHSVIHPARLSRAWDSLKNQTEQYINDTITTTIISKDEMEDYLLCIVAGLQWQDDLTQFSHDKALYTHVPFWHTINSFRKTSPTYGKMVNITRSLMDHKVKQLFDDAATIKSCFKHLVKEFPLRAFNDMHQTIAIIWINMRDALLNGFFHGINNDTVIDGFNLGICKRVHQFETDTHQQSLTAKGQLRVLRWYINLAFSDTDPVFSFRSVKFR